MKNVETGNFLSSLGKTPSRGLEMQQKIHEDNTISCTYVFEWLKKFKKGREAVKDSNVVYRVEV